MNFANNAYCHTAPGPRATLHAKVGASVQLVFFVPDNRMKRGRRDPERGAAGSRADRFVWSGRDPGAQRDQP
jgi:hypothetical protein